MAIDPPFHEKYGPILTGSLFIIALIVTLAALKVSKIVVMPLAFAVFLMMVIHPVDRWFKQRLPAKMRWLALLLTMLLLSGILGGFGFALWVNIDLASQKFPQYTNAVLLLWKNFAAWGQAHGIPIQANLSEISGLLGRVVNLFTAGLTSLALVVGILILIFVLVMMLLLEIREWQNKLEIAFGKKHAANLKSAILDIASKVRRFMWLRTLISLTTGLVVWLWLWIVGVDMAFLWGFFAFLLNYIPNLGSIISVIPPSLIALLQYDLRWAGLTIAGLTLIQQVIGNYIEPRLQGRVLSISPMILLVSLIFWGWFWGLTGALLAVPLTVTLIVTCLHIPALKPLALLLSRPPKALLCAHQIYSEDQCKEFNPPEHDARE